MKIWVDADLNELACVPEVGVPFRELLFGKTNNEAEYLAVVAALKHFSGVTEILSDSQLVVNQLNHKWAIKEGRLRDLAEEAWNLSCGQEVRFTWVPREQNRAGKLLE